MHKHLLLAASAVLSAAAITTQVHATSRANVTAEELGFKKVFGYEGIIHQSDYQWHVMITTHNNNDGGGRGNVHSSAGASAVVSAAYAPAFQALIDDLEAHGAVIKFMGGIRPGRCAQAHKHSCGMALDICQHARSVIDSRCHLPGLAIENQIAAAHGLFHGAQWCRPDRGHFEVGGSAACGQSWAHVHQISGTRVTKAYMRHHTNNTDQVAAQGRHF